jgi:hypothetical protein
MPRKPLDQLKSKTIGSESSYDRKVEEPFENLDWDAEKLLSERHDRIKTELRTNLATLIGISGGAIVLSLTLFEKIAPEKRHQWLLVLAWVFLAGATVVAMTVLVSMTIRSIGYQDYLKKLYNEGKMQLIFHGGPGTPGGKYWEVVTERMPGELGNRVTIILFAFGVLFLAAYGVLNVLHK